MRWRRVVLWAMVLLLGTAFGAGLYESRVVLPGWNDIPPSQWPNTGLMFWAYVTTVPLTLVTLLSLVASWKDRTPRGRRWRAAAWIALVERLATFGYFIPTMVGMMNAASPSPEISETLVQWTTLNYGRHALTLAAWLASLGALSAPDRPAEAAAPAERAAA